MSGLAGIEINREWICSYLHPESSGDLKKEGDLGGSPSGHICVLEEGGRGHTMAGTAEIRGQGTLGRF